MSRIRIEACPYSSTDSQPGDGLLEIEMQSENVLSPGLGGSKRRQRREL
jgi:hypothetical protein